MIFVTVGLHTQGFDRLIKEVDKLKAKGCFDDKVIQQIGYSDFKPSNCEWSSLYPNHQIEKYMQEARIIITHGGPSSY